MSVKKNILNHKREQNKERKREACSQDIYACSLSLSANLKQFEAYGNKF